MEKKKNYAIRSIVLGIVTIIFWFSGYQGLIFNILPIIGLIYSIKEKNSEKPKLVMIGKYLNIGIILYQIIIMIKDVFFN